MSTYVADDPDLPGEDQPDVNPWRSGQRATPLAASLAQAVQAWRAAGEFSEQTVERFALTVTKFGRRLERQGISAPEQVELAHAQGFVDAATAAGRQPELQTRHFRRTALRVLFRTLRELGYEVGDPTLDLQLPPRTANPARPLTDAEVGLCRASTRLGVAGSSSLHRAVAFALAEATAVTGEISTIRVSDVDHPNEPQWVHLPGTRRHDPRLGELTDWGRLIVARQLTLLTAKGAPASTLLTYAGRAVPGGKSAQASMCMAVSAVLDLAGFADQSDVRPASVRNWAGRRLYEQGMPLEQVARRLGSRSLDTAAGDIDLTWRCR